MQGSQVSISGYVSDEDLGNVEVEIDGVLSGSAYPNSSGYFTFAGEAYDVGKITARAYDYEEGLYSNQVAIDLVSNVPSIVSLTITHGPGREITISGQVIDEDPQYATVYVDGAASDCISPDANGNFSMTFSDASLGTISAYVEDAFHQYSEYAYANVTSDLPSIVSLTITHGPGREITISGQIIDDDPQSATVYIDGAASGSVTPDANGNFSLTVSDASLGTLYAYVEDVFYQYSAYAYAEVTSNAPEILNFGAIVTPSNTLWVEGDVDDEDAGSVTIIIYWWDNEYEVTPDENGHFYWYLGLEEGQEGTVSAIATDCWGLESSQVEDFVLPI